MRKRKLVTIGVACVLAAATAHVSIGTQKGPPIGIQKGPLSAGRCGLCR